MLQPAPPRPERIAPPATWRPPSARKAFPLVLAGAVAAITVFPYVLAYLLTPPGQHFMSFFFMADDATSYISKMRTGLEGGWLWDNRYISLAPTPVLVYTPYLALGHLAGLLHLPLIAVYHLARVLGGAALAAVAYALARELRLDAGGCRAATFLVFFGSGFGFLAQLLGNPAVGPMRVEAVDLHLPEVAGFYSTLAMPHFVWAAALLAAGLLLVVRTVQRPSARRSFQAGLAWTALALIHPQMLPVGVLAIAGWLGLRWSAGHRTPLVQLVHVALGFLPAVPLLAYDAWILRTNPMVMRWSEEWSHAAPTPLSMILGLGLPLALALAALPAVWRRRSRLEGLLACWLVAVAILLYLPNPVSVQRRLLDGIYIPVTLLAAQFLFAPPASWNRRRARLTRVALVVSCFSSLLVLAIALRFALGALPAIYQSEDVVAGFTWLRSAPRGAVLSSPGVGLYIPAWSGQRAYVGHYGETIDYFAKARTAGRILSAGTPDDQARSFFETQRITYLFWGPEERAARSFDPASRPYLDLVFLQGSVAIYRYIGDACGAVG